MQNDSFSLTKTHLLIGIVILSVVLVAFAFLGGTSQEGADPQRPNIALVLADDMGIGDVSAYNPEAKLGLY